MADTYDLTTDGGIPYNLIAGPEHDVTREGWSATETYRMLWDNLVAFVAESFPTNVFIGTGTVYSYSRSMPGYPWLRTKTVKFSPFVDGLPAADTSAGSDYRHMAKVVVTYETVSNQQEQDASNTILSHKASIGGEFITLASSGFKWEGEAEIIKNDDIAPGKLIPEIEHQFTWEYVPLPPFSAIRSRIGCVNDGSFFGAASETLLFMGAELERQVTNQGVMPWKVDYRFKERIINMETTSGVVGWNHSYKPDDGTFVRLVAATTGDFMYKKVDFTPLFQQ